VQSERPDVIARMVAAVSADGSLTDAQKTDQIQSTQATIGWYYSLPENKARLGLYLDALVKWCRSNGISPNRIMANEYGVTRDNVAFRGAPTASRISWLNAMADLLNARGRALRSTDVLRGLPVRPMTEWILGRCRRTWATSRSATQCAIPSCPRLGSRTSGDDPTPGPELAFELAKRRYSLSDLGTFRHIG
jgi:hypothetical protein